MERHPLYPEVGEFCERYPHQAGALWQAYIDLKLSQRWEDVTVNDLPAAKSAYITGTRPTKEARIAATVFPMHLALPTDMKTLNGLFDQIQPSPPSIYLAISAEDSSIVYYKIANGIVPPKEIKD